MKQVLLLAGALLLLGGGLTAQEDSLPKIQKELDRIYRTAGKKGPDPVAIAEIVERLIDLGTDQKSEPAGFDAFSLALDTAGYLPAEKQSAVFVEALDALIENYLDDDRMAQLVMGALSYPADGLKEKAAEYLAWIERDSKSPSVKCATVFKKKSKEAAGAIDPARCKELTAEFEALKKQYGGAKGPYGQPWSQMLDEQIESLKIVGTPAKEITGVDLDGVAFKLSEYRGKAVILDFWGYW